MAIIFSFFSKKTRKELTLLSSHGKNKKKKKYTYILLYFAYFLHHSRQIMFHLMIAQKWISGSDVLCDVIPSVSKVSLPPSLSTKLFNCSIELILQTLLLIPTDLPLSDFSPFLSTLYQSIPLPPGKKGKRKSYQPTRVTCSQLVFCL